jgi:very-short-patch-repair endonuclease
MARQLRRDATPAEEAAWRLLRNRGVLGLKFRRQQIIEGFIVDFYCTEIRTALELDGGVHEAQTEYDALRDAVLARAGIRVIRIGNEDVRPAVLERALRLTRREQQRDERTQGSSAQAFRSASQYDETV